MKFLALFAAAALALYFLLARQSSLSPLTEAVSQTEVAPLTRGGRDVTPAGSNALKRPFDRTHEVLSQAKARNGDGEF